MKGERVQPDEYGYPPSLQAGQYVRVCPVKKQDGSPIPEEERGKWYNQPYWMACTPNGHVGNLSRHDITEHEDGTITVSPSILVSTSYDGGKTTVELWHGYLERGVWRSV